MGKKCIPGLFCIENMTLFILCLIVILILYMFYKLSDLGNQKEKIYITQTPSNGITYLPPISTSIQSNLIPISTRGVDILSDPYVPPIREDNGYRINRNRIENSQRPMTISTQSYDSQYQQIGILTRKQQNSYSNSPEILPLMGRRQLTSRDKWQYYTISNDHIKTKLPVSVKGKSCTNEYGCDEIYNNDTVYVEGFKDIFIATIYENNNFAYIP
jgi:hypothetical protein